MNVAECLALAAQAHKEYRDAVTHRREGGVVEGNPTLARAALQRAYDALSEAEGLDPHATDAAWQEYPHFAQSHELLVFYRRQLEGK